MRLERLVGPDCAGMQGFLGHGKHFNLLAHSVEKPLGEEVRISFEF